MIVANLPAPALAALRAEVEQALRDDPSDDYYTQMASAVIRAEQAKGVRR